VSGPLPSIAVIGGGIAGLAVSYELMERAERLKQRIDLRCLEGADRPGGNIRTTRENGFLCEWGATGFLDNAPATVTLVRRLALGERMIKASAAAARRFIFRKGKLREVPLGPGAFLTSGVLSPWGRLRLLLEPLIPRRRSPETESVFDFASRRIGRPAAGVLVDAMVAGVYAGDSRQLELETTFPQMRRMESEHGSLFRAMLAKRKQAGASGETLGGPAGPGGTLTSFHEGLEELIDGLARALASRLCLNTPASACTCGKVHRSTSTPWCWRAPPGTRRAWWSPWTTSWPPRSTPSPRPRWPSSTWATGATPWVGSRRASASSSLAARAHGSSACSGRRACSTGARRTAAC
jgi:oxygen-dependent protoporphyrinogen oxidase